LLDLSKPAAVLFVAFLHFIPDDDPAYCVVRTLRDALAPNSYIIISHGTYDNAPPLVMQQFERLRAGTPTPAKYRTRAQIEPFFDGLELVEPGLVHTPLWRPEGLDDIFLDQPERCLAFAGIGRKL
jgi:hypothetical protein